LNRLPCCPGKKGPRNAGPKRAGKNLPSFPLFVSAKRRGGKGSAGLKRRKPAFRKEEPPPFLARRMLFCPGRVFFGQRRLPRFAEPLKIKTLQKENHFPFQPDWGLPLNIKITKFEYQTPFLFFLVFGFPGSYNQPIFGDRRFHLQRIYPQWSNRSLPTPSKTS
jgi:hypothetical protein